jgi:fatty-acyl-CoA synthase
MDAVEKEKITSMYGVPTMFLACLEENQKKKRDVTSLNSGIMAGSLCPEKLMRRVNNEFGMKNLQIAYGMTETSPVSF